MADRIRIVEGDASQSHWYAGDVPADVVLVCGVFGNISAADITRTIQAMRGFCVPGGHVMWTRHRRPPDPTPAIRADFAAAGFTELAFEAPDGTVMTVGHHRLDGADGALRPRPAALRLRRRRVQPRMSAGDPEPDARRSGRAPTHGPIGSAGAAPESAGRRRPSPQAAKPAPPSPPPSVELTSMAWRTARMEPARVIVPALVIFGLDAIQGTFFTEIAVDHLGSESIIGGVFSSAPPRWG